jgi:hypothetical protein
LKRDTWVRQTHRWLSITFTVTILITSVALALELAVDWVVYLPLLPLFLLLGSGLYLFVLPYALKRRSVRAE